MGIGTIWFVGEVETEETCLAVSERVEDWGKKWPQRRRFSVLLYTFLAVTHFGEARLQPQVAT